MQESIPLQLNEEILSIIGYEGLYSITSYGRVWSHGRIRKFGNNSQRIYKGKFLKSGLTKKTGYLHVNLYIDNKIKSFLVHRLEATAYILNPSNLSEVNHKDGIKANNHKDNLEWCDDQGNKNHAMKNGLHTYKHTSKLYGVGFHKGKGHKNKPWQTYATINKKSVYLGFYKIEVEAAKAYNDYVLKHNLNRPLNKF